MNYQVFQSGWWEQVQFAALCGSFPGHGLFSYIHMLISTLPNTCRGIYRLEIALCSAVLPLVLCPEISSFSDLPDFSDTSLQFRDCASIFLPRAMVWKLCQSQGSCHQFPISQGSPFVFHFSLPGIQCLENSCTVVSFFPAGGQFPSLLLS